MSRSFNEIESADLVVFVTDSSEAVDIPEEISKREHVVVQNKVDLLPDETIRSRNGDRILISAVTGYGIDGFIEFIGSKLKNLSAESSQALLQARHFELLSKASEHLFRGRNLFFEGASPEFVISEVHSALELVLEILGKKFDDQVMDRVFREFCLGK
jgi:tRNA U34 5-carboxymethylaminomethyl modifying GTPase MnmE/TrmE